MRDPLRPGHRALVVGAALALLAGGVALLTAAAPAAALVTFTVTTDADAGPGSLRAAMDDAVFANDDVTIVIPPEVGDITLTSGEVVAVTYGHDLTIVGSGQAVVQTTPGARVMRVLSDTKAHIEHLTITGGDNVPWVGAGIYQEGVGLLELVNVTVTGNVGGGGAGAFSEGAAAVIGSTITDNHAVAPANPNWGGGVYATGDLMVIDSEVSGNISNGDGGGIYAWGDIAVSDSRIVGNEARGGTPNTTGGGGGIFTRETGQFGTSNVVVARSTIADNTAAGEGGGISAADAVTVAASTLHGNTATVIGGAVAAAEATFTNATLSGNTAGRRGGAVIVGDGSATLQFATVVGNAAEEGASLYGDATLHGTVLAGAVGGDHCEGGTVVSTGSNLADDVSCALVAGGDQQAPGLDPVLGPLADNGGPTVTHLPLAASPLLDAVPVAACGPAGAVDQRGEARPVGPACEIGAVEVQQDPEPETDPETDSAPPSDPAPAPPAPVVAQPRFTG